MYKTKQYKRYAKCDNPDCPGVNGNNGGLSFPLPKRGRIIPTALLCPITLSPILTVAKSTHSKRMHKAYWWTAKGPCFTCKYFQSKALPCKPIKELKVEFATDELYGWTRDDLEDLKD